MFAVDLTLEDSGGFGCVIDRDRPDVSYVVEAWSNLTVTILSDEGKNYLPQTVQGMMLHYKILMGRLNNFVLNKHLLSLFPLFSPCFPVYQYPFCL